MFEIKKVINCGRNNKSKRKKKKYPFKIWKKKFSVNLSKGYQNANTEILLLLLFFNLMYVEVREIKKRHQVK